MNLKLPCLILSTVFLLAVISVAEEKKLTVGAVLGLTGYAAEHAANIREGVELAREELKAEGTPVEVIYEDDGTTAPRSLTGFQFLARKGIKFFIGPTWSFQANSVLPFLAKEKLIAVAPAMFSQTAGGSNGYLFFLNIAGAPKTAALAKWLSERNFKKAAIIYADGDWGEVHRKIFEDACRQAGLPVETTLSYTYGTEESAIPPLMARLLKTDPDIVLTTGADIGEGIIINKAAQAKSKAVFVGTEDIDDAMRQGLIKTGSIKVPLYVITNKISGDFIDKFRKHYGRAPGIYADKGYEALKILALAFEKKGTDTEAVRSFLINDLKYPGTSAEIDFDDKGDISTGAFQVVEIKQ